ncbi:MAG TPA: zf-HC2 domain-containing protein [Pyrinomonadaceae bacterium]|nr:zf-HC2 domain-containing protein [Pyrinomonadaceae bacterium]
MELSTNPRVFIGRKKRQTEDLLAMTEHVTTAQMERFCVSGLPQADLAAITEHLTHCQLCHDLFADTLSRQRGSGPISFTLSPEFWLRHEHVDFEQLVAIADNKLDETDREMIDIHLGTCSSCQEDLRNLLAFRQEVGPELQVRNAPPIPLKPRPRTLPRIWLQSISRNPVYAAAAVILIAVALVIGMVVLRHRSGVFEASKNPTPQASPKPILSGGGTQAASSPAITPAIASNSPTPLREPTPKKSGENTPPPNETLLALNDGRGTVTIDRSGNVAGLDDLPPDTKRDVVSALTAERIERAAIINSLAPESATLRSNGNKGAPFRLLAPERSVIVEDSPIFKWERLSGASTYRVYVLDSRGRQVTKSGDLASTLTQWSSTALDRGNIYSWVVVAVVDGKEIVSPGATASAMKFQVLPSTDLQKLNQLKRTRSHLAVGVFYASVGLVAEAERELQELVRLNPNDTVAKKLLRSVRSVRGAAR